MDSEILLCFSWTNFQEFRKFVHARSRNSAVSTPDIACGLYNSKYDVDEANTTMTYLTTSSLPGLSIVSMPSLLPVARKRKYSQKRVYVAVAVAYSVWVSFAITARNSSSRLDWVVSSSLSLHILIRPCESPVASVWRLETNKKKLTEEYRLWWLYFTVWKPSAPVATFPRLLSGHYSWLARPVTYLHFTCVFRAWFVADSSVTNFPAHRTCETCVTIAKHVYIELRLNLVYIAHQQKWQSKFLKICKTWINYTVATTE